MSSKVAVALPPSHVVSRPRLNDRLNEGVRGPLTLVAAGPGSGKTVLVSDWATAQTLPTAWVSVEASDNDPHRFWTLVGQALATSGIVSEADALAGLPHDRADAGPFVMALLDAVPGSAEFALVIDDAHVLSSEIVLAELDAVIRYASPRWHLVLTARSDPLLPLHRYRLAGDMVEVRAGDLAMTRAEAQALLTAHGVSLRGPELAMLTRRTEGWAAGLRLSAMSMAGSDNPEQFVTQLTLDQGSVGEYLIEEVLNRQPDRVRRLLIQSSFLEGINGSLVAAVTGIEDSAELLADLARTNSFVLVDRQRPDHYRFHQLFAEILRHLLRSEYGAQLPDLRCRAGAWYLAHDDPAAAMRFVIEAGDLDQAASVLVHGGFARAFVERLHPAELGLTGELSFADERARGLGDGEREVAGAVVALMSGQLELAASQLSLARTRGLSADVEATALLVEIAAAQRAQALPELDRVAASLFAGERPAGGVLATAGLLAAVQLRQAAARLWEYGAGQQVEALLVEVTAEAHREGVVSLELESLAFLQLSYAISGRSEHAKDCEVRAHLLLRRFPQLQRSSVQHLATTVVAFLRMDLGSAAKAVRRAKQTANPQADPALAAAVELWQARVVLAAGQVADAYLHLRSAPELSIELPGQLSQARCQALAEIETRMGRPNAALKVLAEAGPVASSPVLAVMAARAHLALGDSDAAAEVLRPVLTASEPTAALPVLVAALLTSAKVAELRGDEPKAVQEVLRATGLAGEAITFPFVDALPMLSGLLARHPEVAAAWPAHEAERGPLAGAARPSSQFLAEPLTDRETAVLRRLATTMTAAEIGDELCVSINTIKTHIAAIYRKLPAAGRRDAVARARALELL